MANLSQLRVLEELSGFLLVDKPVGIAFSTVVKTVKRAFGLVKVGHGGSLDASASGLLVVLLGDANKFAAQVMGCDREYDGTFQFGGTTNTGDSHGVPSEMPTKTLSAGELKGDIFQAEPRFAAIRREGTGDYEIVDTGDHAPALVHVYRFDVGTDGRFALRATRGVIPRALAIDMGATLTTLRRTKVGKFCVEDAIQFDRLLETDRKDFASCVIPTAKALL